MANIVDRDSGEVYEFPRVRTPYEHAETRRLITRGTALVCVKPSRTKQSFKEEVDINTIVKRFGLTGQLPENVRVPVSADYVDAVSDYQTAMNIVRSAQEEFMRLPSAVRERFGNDPQKLQMFVEDEKNLDEARKLGIAKPAPVPAPKPEPMEVRVIPDDVSRETSKK